MQKDPKNVFQNNGKLNWESNDLLNLLRLYSIVQYTDFQLNFRLMSCKKTRKFTLTTISDSGLFTRNVRVFLHIYCKI